jgi:hypothetical protein
MTQKFTIGPNEKFGFGPRNHLCHPCFFHALVLLMIGVSAGTTTLYCQNLENIGKGRFFGLSGGITASSVLYNADGIDGRRDPYNYFFSGNLNLSIYDWSVPFIFSYSNQHVAFRQPFNQYGLSPTFKWLTLHVGYRSMIFSPYTVSGHVFLGGGFDITPSANIRISAFYGRLQKSVKEDTLQQNNSPAYKRMGGGIKVTVGNEKNFVHVIVFKAHDDPHSLSRPPEHSHISPEENLVLGSGFGISLMERLSLKGEIASSAMSTDIRSERMRGPDLYEKLGFAFSTRTSSSFYHAYKAAFQYSGGQLAMALAYERVDPGYRTLGAYYFNNNMETISLNGSGTAFKKKARVNGQVGIQRNNLDNREISTMNRLSASINASYQASKRFLCSVMYSNFQTVVNFRSDFNYLNQVSPYENLDTLNFRQITRHATMNANFVLNQSKERRQNISANLSLQKTADVHGLADQRAGAALYNFNSAYSIVFEKRRVNVNAALNGNYMRSTMHVSKIYGPNISIRKTFLGRKLSANASISYNNSFTNDLRTGKIMNLRVSGNYTFRHKHQFDLNVSRVSRLNSQIETQEGFSELTAHVGYSYNFSAD